MVKSFCEIWWELQKEFAVYQQATPGLRYFLLPDDRVGSAQSKLHQLCRDLQLPELFGPEDSSLLDRCDDPLFGSSWRRFRPFQAAGLRIGRFQDECVQLAIDRQEICAKWIGDPPNSPVNDTVSLHRYLREQCRQIFLCSSESMLPNAAAVVTTAPATNRADDHRTCSVIVEPRSATHRSPSTTQRHHIQPTSATIFNRRQQTGRLSKLASCRAR